MPAHLDNPFATEANTPEPEIQGAAVFHEGLDRDIFADCKEQESTMEGCMERSKILQSQIRDIKFISNTNAALLRNLSHYGEFIKDDMIIIKSKLLVIESKISDIANEIKKINSNYKFIKIFMGIFFVIFSLISIFIYDKFSWHTVDLADKLPFDIKCEYAWIISENIVAKPPVNNRKPEEAQFKDRGPVRFTAVHVLGKVIVSDSKEVVFFIDYDHKNLMGWAGMSDYDPKNPETMKKYGFSVDLLQKRCY